MIDVIFDPNVRDSAIVTGVYQYDKGQRMRLFNLPSPQEFAGEDDLLSGDSVAMMVQFAYAGDAQTESRLAIWNEDVRAWIVEVPDYYLFKHEAVDVYIVIAYGYTEEESGGEIVTRARDATAYTLSYVPAKRSAPGDTVSPEQITAWSALVTEVNLAINRTNAATTAAQNATQDALDATVRAEETIAETEERMNAFEAQWGGTTTSVETLEPDSDATVELSDKDGVKHLAYGIPRGRDGKDGERGPTGPAGVTFTLTDGVLYITTDEPSE